MEKLEIQLLEEKFDKKHFISDSNQKDFFLIDTEKFTPSNIALYQLFVLGDSENNLQ